MPSGYFSEPSDTLDPALFSGMTMYPETRAALLHSLTRGLESIGLNRPEEWVHAWVAGSGVSYQWKADRGNGDLDVLFGVDLPAFLDANPHIPGLSAKEIASFVNGLLKQNYWPKTSHFIIHGKEFEVTYYWNYRTSWNIVDTVHPYAAYDLIQDSWAVLPPVLPKDPRSLYPQQWHAVTEADFSNAWKIQDLYHSGPSGRLQGGNAARALWREIHEGRHEAFSDVGGGYGDFHNYRWQRAKETGAAEILRGIVSETEELPKPSDLVTRAAMRYASGRYTS